MSQYTLSTSEGAWEKVATGQLQSIALLITQTDRMQGEIDILRSQLAYANGRIAEAMIRANVAEDKLAQIPRRVGTTAEIVDAAIIRNLGDIFGEFVLTRQQANQIADDLDSLQRYRDMFDGVNKKDKE